MSEKTFADYRIETGGKTGNIYIPCPECSNERKKKSATCLSVNVDKGVWNCHHCGWTGGLKRGVERKKELATVYKTPEAIKPNPIPEKWLRYFQSRGIGADVLERNEIQVGKVWMPQVEGWVEAVNFPYYRGDKLINRKWRDFDKNFRMEAGAERILYGLRDVQEITIIVEGEFDKLAVEVAGSKNCVSVPNGAPSPTSKNYATLFSFLSADEDALSVVKKWVIAVDADAPGKRLEEELARRLGPEKCFRIIWPDGIKDANEALQLLGPEGLAELIGHAEPYPIAGIHGVQGLKADVLELYRNGIAPGVKTGWDLLDRFWTVKPGEMTIVTGVPSHGKSSWVENLALNLVELHGWAIGLCSPESLPLSDHLAHLVEKWVRKPFYKGEKIRMTEQDVVSAIDELAGSVNFLLAENGMSVEWVITKAQSLVYRHGIRLLIIDPWNELEHMRPPAKTESEYIGESLILLRRWARTAQVHLIIVAHPAKMVKRDDDVYPVPTLYNISGSAHWSNKADNGITVWRNPADEKIGTEVHIQKVRRKETGRPGMVVCDYDKPSGVFTVRPYTQQSEQKPQQPSFFEVEHEDEN